MEHIVIGRRSARKASISSAVMRMDFRWFTPCPMASLIRRLPIVRAEA
jgi:hypothetical protein